MGILADIHCAPATSKPYTWQNLVDLPHSAELLDAGLAWLAEQQVDALVLLGDLTETADGESLQHVGARAVSLETAVAAVPGNCDVDADDRSLAAFEAIQQSTLVISPDVVGIGPGRVLELVHLAAQPDSTLLVGVQSANTASVPHSARIILSHYPVLDLEPALAAAGFRHSGNLANRAEIERDLRALEMPVVVVHGHLHIHDAHISGNLLHLSCGALIEPPHLVSLIELTFDGDRIEVSRSAHSVRHDEVDRLPVFAPLDQRWAWTSDSWRRLADENDCGMNGPSSGTMPAGHDERNSSE
jgi:predicted phosphodiesterase